MPQYAEKPNILNFEIDLRIDSKTAFIDWQGKLNAALSAYPGFVSLEFLSPSGNQKNWLLIQRFSNRESVASWQSSAQYKELMSALKTLTVTDGIQEITTEVSNIREGVTEVIVTEVNPENEQAFRDWSAKIHQAEAKFPGFRGLYMQSPSHGKGRHWITLLQFDTLENLDRWLESQIRHELLKESTALVLSFESHRIFSPYAGWFASIAKVGEVPPVWKQTMLVLLVLFPIVMLEVKYLSPLLSGLDSSVAMFISNTISVMLISYPMMPLAIWLLGWWLSPQKRSRQLISIVGTLTVISLYLIEIILFWHFY